MHAHAHTHTNYCFFSTHYFTFPHAAVYENKDGALAKDTPASRVSLVFFFFFFLQVSSLDSLLLHEDFVKFMAEFRSCELKKKQLIKPSF